MTRKALTEIPRYYLYEDALEDVEQSFLHAEPIRERSGAHDWTIRAHAHPDHIQLLFVEHGGGTIRIEGQDFEVPTYSLVVVPAAMVHEIVFRTGTDGTVITAAAPYVRELVKGDARLLEAISTPQAYALEGNSLILESIQDAIGWIKQEYVWAAQGRRVAIKAHLLRLLVDIMRLRSVQAVPSRAAKDRDYEILLKYRELLERYFRAEKTLDFYAKHLGVGTQRLNQACRARAGKTSSELLHERILIEAKRYLVYMEMTVAEVGYELGFDDPAYFSRFFSQRVGQAPGAYRAEHARR